MRAVRARARPAKAARKSMGGEPACARIQTAGGEALRSRKCRVSAMKAIFSQYHVFCHTFRRFGCDDAGLFVRKT